MTDEEKKKVEDLVNSWIEKDFKIRFEELTQEEAKNRGAIGLFGEKYGEKVKVYTIGEGNTRDANTPSIEFCGGPHVEHTGQIGEGNKKFKISKEEAVSQGVRRIKAVVE
jgi:alanyl-tRNA synthetase